MSRNVRSGTWTLAEFYMACHYKIKTSSLWLRDYKMSLYAEWDSEIFFQGDFSEIPCLTDANKNTICSILSQKYADLVVGKFFEDENGDIECGDGYSNNYATFAI